MKNKLRLLLLSMTFVVCLAGVSVAGELDVLLNKLVDKGVLTPIEADIVKDETKQQVAAELDGGKSYAVPSWVQKLKIKQDFRLRHQWERKNSDDEGRNRTRVRYRLGLESKVAKGVSLAAGLATGGTDARSTNETLEDAFETPDIRLDYAYLEWTPNAINGLTIAGGKHKRKPYLWLPTDMLWDGDVNPNGLALNYQTELVDNIALWSNAAWWVVDHRDQDDPDPSVGVFQLGLSGKSGMLDAKGAVTYHDFSGLKGRAAQTGSGGTNSTSGGVISNDFDTVSLGAEVGFKELLGGLPFSIDERIAVFGEWVTNNEADSAEDGYAIGVKFGKKKAKKPGDWQFKYQHVELESDAFVDFLPDSDRLGGDTNIESDEFAFKYVVKPNVLFGLDYYISDVETGTSDEEHLVQADVLLKF